MPGNHVTRPPMVLGKKRSSSPPRCPGLPKEPNEGAQWGSRCPLMNIEKTSNILVHSYVKSAVESETNPQKIPHALQVAPRLPTEPNEAPDYPKWIRDHNYYVLRIHKHYRYLFPPRKSNAELWSYVTRMIDLKNKVTSSSSIKTRKTTTTAITTTLTTTTTNTR